MSATRCCLLPLFPCVLVFLFIVILVVLVCNVYLSSLFRMSLLGLSVISGLLCICLVFIFVSLVY
uniref:Uncharacterized protein n=1 Tax=Anguilla anguilla TaxID=7936 RepID=A0A0E9W541_ANGAN